MKFRMRYSSSQLKNIPPLPGIYKFYSPAGKLLYVGKAKNLVKRISSYFDNALKEPKVELMISQIGQIEVIPVSSEFEALLLEARLIRDKQPKYNVVWRDDKQYIYIKITREKFPKIFFARKADQTGAYFGPFPSSAIVKEILSYLRSIFPFCTQRESVKKSCFYHHLGLCNPCPSEIIKCTGIKYQLLRREYLRNIRNIKQILSGKTHSIKKLLSDNMQLLSKKEKYEEAAIFRDKLNKLDYLVNQYAPVDSYLNNPEMLDVLRKKERLELENILIPYFSEIGKINHIECYDISNISGKLATGSMVTFKHGAPVKNLYRKFRIKSKNIPDDFGMLQELMTRRLNHLEWQLPDIFVIDGGMPQLAALTKIMKTLKIKIPIIGLAKTFEEIVVPVNNSYSKINLPICSPALNLIKRIRDEAHRFAHAYHTHLRLKYLINS